MPDMTFTELVLNSRGWLKEVAPPNMPDMSVTELVSKSRGWLNEVALANMVYMLVTELVSKAKGWSKADAPRNIYCILVTELVFQPPIGSLKVLMSRNNPSIELTLPVSHSDMDPRVSRFDGHISTASRSSSKLFGVNTQKKKI